jgi:hypothetical protein
MEQIIDVQDRAALLRQGVALVDARLSDGRLSVEVTGVPEDRVRAVVAEQLGPSTRVLVVDDLPRRLYARPCVGHMEREEKRLQLRYVLWPDEHMADVVVIEDAESVVVFGMICVAAACEPGDACEVPTHVYLDSPLGGRKVYDGCSGEEVPYKNVWIKIQERIDREGWPPAEEDEDEGRAAAGGDDRAGRAAAGGDDPEGRAAAGGDNRGGRPDVVGGDRGRRVNAPSGNLEEQVMEALRGDPVAERAETRSDPGG